MVKENENEIRALISLLGDDDDRIRKIARKKLLDSAEFANPLLEEAAFSDYEGRIRIEAQRILAELRFDRLSDELYKLTRPGPFDLERACFLLAQIEYPNLHVPSYASKLDRLAQEIQHYMSEKGDLLHQVHIMNHVLFNEHSFRGNVDAYYDPQNSYINRVIDRHVGIPISLSALYLFLAERLHIRVSGVSTPGHFLLKFQYKGKHYFIDAFNRGQILTQDACVRFIEKLGYPFDESYMASSKPKSVFTRMIRNLLIIYQHNDQPTKFAYLERFLETMT